LKGGQAQGPPPKYATDSDDVTSTQFHLFSGIKVAFIDVKQIYYKRHVSQFTIKP